MNDNTSQEALNAFIRGYSVVPKDWKFHLPWRQSPLGRHFCIYAHDKTEIVVVGGDNASVCFVGRAYDLDTAAATESCAKIALAKFLEHGFDSALQYIAYLGGRFAVFIAEHDTLHAIPDCHATYAIYSLPLDDSYAFCSHWMLASEIANLSPSERVSEFMGHPSYVEPAGKYYPALWTPFEGVTCVFPNCRAAFDVTENHFIHQRFYPFEDLPIRSVASAYPEFSHLLARSVELAATGRVALSLTNGGDSRTVLAALPRPYEQQTFSFTYGRMASLDNGAKTDILGGNAVAFRAGIPHRIFDLLQVDYGCGFHKIYSKSFANGARFPSLARLYYENLPHDCTIIISTVGETGTIFYKERSNLRPIPEVLASKFTTSKAQMLPEIIEAFHDYIIYTQFEYDKIFNYDWHDLFYWEHRNAKWASAWYAEVDMTGFAIAPYNSRRLIEVMLSVSPEDRRSRVLQYQFVQEKGLA